MKGLIAALLSCVVVLLGCGTEPVVEKGLTYVERGGTAIELDLARPARGRGPFPALMFVSGGGFRSPGRTEFAEQLVQAARRGYVAVDIDYRLTRATKAGKTKYPFPSQLQDAQCALQWLQTNAARYKIDTNRIGIVGFAAGGNLALMLGMTDTSAGLDGDCGDGGAIQAVVNLGGAADWAAAYEHHPTAAKALLGGQPEEVPDMYRAASPLTYVGMGTAPILSFCGTEDNFLSQLQLFDEKMKAAGTPHTLIKVDGAKTIRVRTELPDFAPLADFSQDEPVWAFLDTHLKAKDNR